jgi:hypothetical protein
LTASPDLLTGFTQLSDAYPDYDLARAHFEGEVPEAFASEFLRRALLREKARYHFRMARIPVTAVVDRLELTACSVPGSDSVSRRLKELLDANDFDVLGPEVHLRAGEYGESYLMVWPLDATDDTPEGLADEELVSAGVEMSYHSPMSVRIVYDEEHPSRKKFAIQRWKEKDYWRADVWYGDRIERFATEGNTAGSNENDWSQYVEDDGPNAGQWPLENPYGEIPFFHFRTERPYGRPLHYDAYGPQMAITKMLVSQLANVDFNTAPDRIGLVDAAAVLDQNGDDPDWDDDAEAGQQSAAAGNSSSMRAAPGTIKLLTGLKDVKQFDGADPKVYTEPVELYVRLMAQLTSTPLHYFDPTGDAPSGESLRTAEAPLVARVHRLQRLFRGPWAEACKFALRLIGVAVDSVDVRWKPAVTIDDPEGWAVIEAKQRSGVPMRQVLMEAGYTAEQADEWLDQQAEEMDLRRRVEILDQMADAIQKLGGAAAMGVVDPGMVSVLIDRIVGQITPEEDPVAA